MKSYAILATLIAGIAYYETYMIPVIGVTLMMTVLSVYLLNRSALWLRKLMSESHIVNIVIVNFLALFVSGVLLILSSYLGHYVNTQILQIAMPVSASSSPVLGLWVPLIFVGNYFFFVFIMTTQLLENNDA